MSIPGIIKIETIIGKFTGDVGKTEVVSEELGVIAKGLLKTHQLILKPANFLLSETGSPVSKVSWGGMIPAARLLREWGFLPSANTIMEASGSHSLKELLITTLEMDDLLGPISSPFKKEGPTRLGELHTKLEAAGKVRVFAMVDVWTQSILKPLHNTLFSLLKSFPNDGTFDQRASVKRCFSKSLASRCSYGYDLSAATDRLPIDLQVSVLTAFFGKGFADAWRHLLVEREYFLPESEGKVVNWESYRYAVGQPMGALSSWAMLAITHHLLVQLASRRAGLSRPGLW